MNKWIVIKFYPNYMINIKGEVKNIQKGTILKKCIDKYGFYYYNLRKDGRNNIVRVGKLMLQTFSEELDIDVFKVSIVGRIDGDIKNDNIDNLYWIKKNPRKIKNIQKIEDNYKEEWKTIPFNDKYEISNIGSVRTKATGLIRNGGLNQGGYITIALSTNGKQKHYLVHRLVMITFQPIENDEFYQVDHINGINSDNRLENLRWVLNIENQQIRKNSRNPIGNIIAEMIKKYGYEKIYNELLIMERRINNEKN